MRRTPRPRRCARSAAAALLLWAVAAPGAEVAAPSVSALARIPEALPGAEPFPAELRGELARALAAAGEGYVPRTRNRRPDGSPRYSNRLLLEASPYLRQHAHNPVNWYPWGDEAFATAERLGRPVLVSIGYSTCHWCHVMEEETFDDPELVGFLNEHFVAVKVDRELRPDVDAIYMTAVQAMNGNGGWPLNVWVTPDRKPFYGGTYFPPADRDGRPGFPTVLRSIHAEYAENPARILQFADRLTAAISANLEGSAAQASQIPGDDALARAVAATASRFDWTWGGVGRGTKFPSSTPIRLLLRYHRRSGDVEAQRMATLTLEKMMSGGLVDHVGGGFHRYATELRWLVPHFEKMLYDNALLALAYLEAAQATEREDFARVARDTLRYVLREMTAPEGGFYSATDADSESPEGLAVEGWFFTWTPEEIAQAVGPEDAKLAIAYYGVTPGGNFEGRNILHTWRSDGEVAEEFALSLPALRERIAGIRERLYAARSQRPPPLRDDKILTAWNGLMIQALARASLVLGEPEWAQAGARAADFALAKLRKDGRLLRAIKAGHPAGPAFLEDYAFLIAGLLDLYEARPDPRWLREAIALQATLDARYADDTGGGYYQTADDHEQLLAREKPGRDGAIPAGNSVAALNLLRLADLSGDEAYRERVGLLFSAFHAALERSPAALTEMLLALEYELDAAKEVVLVRPPGGGGGDEALLATLRETYSPNRVLSIVTEGDDLEAHAALVPLVSQRSARGGRTTAYVCENRVCRFPTSEPAELAAQLSRFAPIGKKSAAPGAD